MDTAQLRASGREGAALGIAIARSGLRSARKELRRRRQPRPIDLVRVACHGQYELRPLRLTDAASWTVAMRANETRMRPWWPPVDDWQRATDTTAFVDHYRQWRQRTRAGSGVNLVVTGPDGVLGEITTWNIDLGSGTGETGVWLYPKISRRHFLPLWASYFDNCLGNIGLRSITSPVAVDNAGPLRLIREVGAERDDAARAVKAAGRGAHDFDYYTLTVEKWLVAREKLHGLFPWEPVTDALPVLSARTPPGQAPNTQAGR